MTLNEILHFIQGFRDFRTLGSLMPTSPRAARIVIQECVRRTGPLRILEVGSGTGAVTAQLVRFMGPEDHLTLCEINPDFVAYLRKRFEEEEPFRRVRDQVRLVDRSVLEMEGTGDFDQIVSMLPFSTMPADLVEDIFECYRRLLAPGGMLAYLEYAGVRQARLAFLRGEAGRQFRRTHEVLERYLKYRVYRDAVLVNVPPGWAHFLRFDEPRPEEALGLQPLEWRRRVSFGPTGVAADVVSFLTGLGALSTWMRRQGLGAWPWPMVLAAGIGAFLRDPHREVKRDSTVAYSACDGRVMAVERLQDPHLGDREWLRISTFLSITDVHINRMPVAGLVVDRFEVPGGAAPAMLPRAEANHSCYMVLETVNGPAAVAQRVGLVARRISNWVSPGELLAQGERYGLIRMGSRTDVYLPAEKAEPLVQPGQVLKAGITPVARYTDAVPR